MGEVDSRCIHTIINPSLRCDSKSDNDERSSMYPFVNAPSMSGGDGDNSYSTNSLLQKRVLSKAKPVLVKNTKGMMINLVPEGLEKNSPSVYITTSSLLSEYKAYLNQFRRDFTTFLEMRSEEVVSNGRMVLTFIGRSTIDDPLYRDCCHFWTLLSKSLRNLVAEGIVSASKVNSFKMPFYDPTKEEVSEIIKNEGSFEIDDLELHGFDLGQSNQDKDYRLHTHIFKAGQKEASCIRAVSEPLLASHFGDDIIDALFNKFAYHASQHDSCMNKTTVSLKCVVSLVRK